MLCYANQKTTTTTNEKSKQTKINKHKSGQTKNILIAPSVFSNVYLPAILGDPSFIISYLKR
jgi:hypothetical protein